MKFKKGDIVVKVSELSAYSYQREYGVKYKVVKYLEDEKWSGITGYLSITNMDGRNRNCYDPKDFALYKKRGLL